MPKENGSDCPREQINACLGGYKHRLNQQKRGTFKSGNMAMTSLVNELEQRNECT